MAFRLMFKDQISFRKVNVKNLFVNTIVTVRKRGGKVINLIPSYLEEMSFHMQRKGIIVEGYKHSIRPYVKFDSPPEKWVADKLEYLCALDKKRKSFWLKNEPQKEYPVEVRPATFYPDFLSFINKKWAIIDVKGRHLAEARQIDNRKKALKLLEKKAGLKTFFLVDEAMKRKGFKDSKIKSLDDFSGFDELRAGSLR